jgi:hypothetical protein
MLEQGIFYGNHPKVPRATSLVEPAAHRIVLYNPTSTSYRILLYTEKVLVISILEKFILIELQAPILLSWILTQLCIDPRKRERLDPSPTISGTR